MATPSNISPKMKLTRRVAVAAALGAAGEGGLSGETLARELGISRMAVSKHVAALKGLGFEVAATPHAGYRLLRTPDACLPETVAPLLYDPLFAGCSGGPVTGSTNDDAKRLAREGAAEGTLVVAAEQRGGRGRFGREWESSSGGAYVSCILRPRRAPSEIGPLSVVLAMGIAGALAALGVPVGLKWPNDLVCDGRKLGGILVEMAAEAERVEWVVTGCGVNVSMPQGPGAAHVREFAPEVTVPRVAAAVADGMAAGYRAYLSGETSTAAEFERWDTLAGTAIVVRDMTGATVAEGIARGIADDGRLIVDLGAGGEQRVVAGEVTLRG